MNQIYVHFNYPKATALRDGKTEAGEGKIALEDLSDLSQEERERLVKYTGSVAITVDEPTWVGVVVAIRAEIAEKKQEHQNRLSEREAKIRELLAAPIEELGVRSWSGIHGGLQLAVGLDNQHLDEDLDADLVQQLKDKCSAVTAYVRDHNEKLEKERVAAQAAREKEREEQERAKVRAVAMLVKSLGSHCQIERFEAGVLPPNELEDIIRTGIFEVSLSEFEGSPELISADLIDHSDDCFGDTERIVWSVAEVDAFNAEPWETFKALKKAVAGIDGASVRAVYDTVECCGCEAQASRLVGLVSVDLADETYTYRVSLEKQPI